MSETKAAQPSLVADNTIPPFRALGYLHGTYFYYSRGEQAVVALPSGAHGKKSLFRLAPQSYWTKHYEGTKKGDFDENTVASILMETCQKAGIFNINRIRGRGVWMDKAGPVIHYGDKVTIEGKDYKPFLTPGKHIYELAEPLGFESTDKLSDKDSSRFPELIKQLRWETPDQYRWFTGWLVCALIGGALPWRPHIWLTGGAQSGKTTLSGLITSILRNNCLYIKSVSTEAGIRQTLKADCLAVVMDEAEREDAVSHSRVQSILTLARQSSSDDDSRIVKGTPLGTALNYQIRSPFCLSSINSSLIQTADKGRFTNIELSGNKLAGDPYREWKANIDGLITEDYVQALYQRIFSMVPAIISNAKEFARVIEAKIGDRRIGDQYGALMAGYAAYSSDKIISAEDAKWMIEDIDFNNEKEQATGKNDQFSLLDKIMQAVIRVPEGKGYKDRSIAELCQIVHDVEENFEECKRALGNIGVKIVDDNIAIANDSVGLAEILEGSRWPHNWGQTLKRLPFAISSTIPVRFSSGCQQRAILLPIKEVIFNE